MTEIESFDITGRVKKITTTQGEYSGGAVIIANGARRRHLNCPGEEEFAGRGVSYCATCDGNFFKNQDVAIAGGGNTALEDALFLSNICSKVYLIHRRNEFRGMKSLSDAVRARSNIELILDSTVESINGDSKVSSVTVKNTVSQSLNELNVSAIFVAVGTEPENKCFKEILKLDKSGYIDASEGLRHDGSRRFRGWRYTCKAVEADCNSNSRRGDVSIHGGKLFKYIDLNRASQNCSLPYKISQP